MNRRGQIGPMGALLMLQAAGLDLEASIRVAQQQARNRVIDHAARAIHEATLGLVGAPRQKTRPLAERKARRAKRKQRRQR